MTALPKKMMLIAAFSLLVLATGVSPVSGAAEGLEATTPDGAMKLSYTARWVFLQKGLAGFDLVTDTGDALMVEQIVVNENAFETVVAGQEDDLKELGPCPADHCGRQGESVLAAHRIAIGSVRNR